ncbi:GIY-YIG nuclease family protein [Actinomyces minihominis]|uniref:GIY-YIG nuclease family protein n=1 Tax=Actinomyces minihominis TaxID=2002838 RepID=UPI000C0698F7|nr:GIY-YIG nuclease family protein [Actinomyces minihominis]
MSGKQIKLFLVEGTTGGLTTAEIPEHWSGFVLSAIRSDLSALLAREEAQRMGVYFLLGEDAEGSDRVRLYIGEGMVADRLRQHEHNKPFWDRAIVVTSNGSHLTKAHAKYLEACLIQMALAADRATLENSNGGKRIPPLPEADRASMNYFLEQLKIVLPVLGVNVIRGRNAKTPGQQGRPQSGGSEEGTAQGVNRESPVFVLTNQKRGVSLRAQEIDGEFTVLKGSKVVAEWDGKPGTANVRRSYGDLRARHEKLLADGAIELIDGIGVLSRDVQFGSPSGAGGVLQGSSCQGPKMWKMEEKPEMTFGAWRARGVSQTPSSESVGPA